MLNNCSTSFSMVPCAERLCRANVPQRLCPRQPRAFAASCPILIHNEQAAQLCPEPWGFPWRQPAEEVSLSSGSHSVSSKNSWKEFREISFRVLTYESFHDNIHSPSRDKGYCERLRSTGGHSTHLPLHRRFFGKAQRLRGDVYAICHRTMYLSPAPGPFCRGHSPGGRGARRPCRLRGPLAAARSVGPGADRPARPCRSGADLAPGVRTGCHAY